MLKNYFIAAITSLAVLLQSCDGFKKTESGLQYKIITDSAGKNAETGDAVVLQLKFVNAKDTFNTVKRGMPVTVLVQKTFEGSLEDGLKLLSAGDSAQFLISSDSLYTKMFNNDSLPKEIKPGSYTDFSVKVLKIYTKAEVKQKEEERLKQAQELKKTQMEYAAKNLKAAVDSSGRQMKTDEGLIKSFIKKNKLDAKKTESGVYYVIQKKGDGPQVVAGDTVSVYYTGKLLNGTGFDSLRTGQPFRLIVGTGQVITGWDDGLTKLSKGDVAKLIIPSPLAYGKMGIKDRNPNKPDNYIIPQNAVLVFDVEVLDVKK